LAWKTKSTQVVFDLILQAKEKAISYAGQAQETKRGKECRESKESKRTRKRAQHRTEQARGEASVWKRGEKEAKAESKHKGGASTVCRILTYCCILSRFFWQASLGPKEERAFSSFCASCSLC
jgi:hypothetical protein